VNTISPRAHAWACFHRYVAPPPRLRPLDCHRRDHTAVGDHADRANREALAQPINLRQQTRHFGGVSRPHVGAHRQRGAVDYQGLDHLLQVGAVDFRIAMLPERLAALGERLNVSDRAVGIQLGWGKRGFLQPRPFDSDPMFLFCFLARHGIPHAT